MQRKLNAFSFIACLRGANAPRLFCKRSESVVIRFIFCFKQNGGSAYRRREALSGEFETLKQRRSSLILWILLNKYFIKADWDFHMRHSASQGASSSSSRIYKTWLWMKEAQQYALSKAIKFFDSALCCLLHSRHCFSEFSFSISGSVSTPLSCFSLSYT